MHHEIINVNQILTDCENFTFTNSKDSLKSWMTSTNRGKRSLIYENLILRIKYAEDNLRNSLNKNIENNYRLIIEARDIEKKLMLSIMECSEFLKNFDNILTDLKSLLKKTSTELAYVSSTLLFNYEVIRMKILFKMVKAFFISFVLVN